MHAILLAAGVGRRLAEITGGNPKCLLPFGGASLLERHLRGLAQNKVQRLTVVTGCEAMQIEQALGALVPRVAPQMTVTTALNPAFRAGSALSVLAAREALADGQPCLLMDADVLFEARVLARLLASAHANCFLLDRTVAATDAEAVKLCVCDGRPVAFGKRLPAALRCEAIGESVGFFRLTPAMGGALVAACARVSEADPDAPYEHALAELLRERPAAFGCEDITGAAWIEIDYPRDVERAENAVLPRIQPEQTPDARRNHP